MKLSTFAAPSLAIALGVILPGCQFQGILSTPTGSKTQTSDAVTASSTPDTFKFFIHGKQISNFSADMKTVTLGLDASDPGNNGGDVQVTWAQDKPFGSFNSTSGKNVQWTASRDGDYSVTLTATVKGSNSATNPDVANFVIPVKGGKIQATEIAPQITVAPQSVVLFHPLPSDLSMTSDQLAALGVNTQAQLTATSYTYNQSSNSMLKQSGDFNGVVWKSGDPSIVTVDDNGLTRPANGSSVGTTLVSVASTTNQSSLAATQVSIQYLSTAITLNYPTTTIYLSGHGTPNTVKIAATVEYSNPTDRNRVIFTDPNGREITWSSSNPSIAQVDTNGNVTPLADAATGDVTITGTSKYDPSRNASITIHVLSNATSNVAMVAR